jgi:hypothetical protein
MIEFLGNWFLGEKSEVTDAVNALANPARPLKSLAGAKRIVLSTEYSVKPTGACVSTTKGGKWRDFAAHVINSMSARADIGAKPSGSGRR